MRMLQVLCALLAIAISSYGTEIRVRNGSKVNFKHVVVGSKDYGNIKKGAVTAYQTWDWFAAYPYSDVSLVAGSKRMELTPIDYVGEHVLGPGHFTYVITIERGHVQIRAVKEPD